MKSPQGESRGDFLFSLFARGWYHLHDMHQEEREDIQGKAAGDAARVVAEHKTAYVVRSAGKDYKATLRGKFHLDEDFPKVGDYVEFAEVENEDAGGENLAVIEKILPRRTVIARDAADRSRHAAAQKPQIIVTNVDVLLIVMGLDDDFNLRRLERYVALAKQCDVLPAIVLNKSDLISGPERLAREAEVSAVAPGVAVHFLSAKENDGIGQLLEYFSHGKAERTVVLLGSSGAGKSTLTNRLLGAEHQATGEIREDDGRGRHTTTSRELFSLPSGGYLIDTPGMRSLGMLGGSDADNQAFADIESLMRQCKYPKCDHEKSEGCAVQEAISGGALSDRQFQGYKKIQKEKEFRASKDAGAGGEAASAQADRRNRTRKLHKEYRKIQGRKYEERGFK